MFKHHKACMKKCLRRVTGAFRYKEIYHNFTENKVKGWKLVHLAGNQRNSCPKNPSNLLDLNCFTFIATSWKSICNESLFADNSHQKMNNLPQCLCRLWFTLEGRDPYWHFLRVDWWAIGGSWVMIKLYWIVWADWECAVMTMVISHCLMIVTLHVVTQNTSRFCIFK